MNLWILAFDTVNKSPTRSPSVQDSMSLNYSLRTRSLSSLYLGPSPPCSTRQLQIIVNKKKQVLPTQNRLYFILLAPVCFKSFLMYFFCFYFFVVHPYASVTLHVTKGKRNGSRCSLLAPTPPPLYLPNLRPTELGLTDIRVGLF